MSKHVLGPDYVPEFESAHSLALRLAAIYAEIAEGIDDPSLQTILNSLTGDMYGHARTLAVFHELIGFTEQHATSPHAEQSSSPRTERLKPRKGGEENGKIHYLSSM